MRRNWSYQTMKPARGVVRVQLTCFFPNAIFSPKKKQGDQVFSNNSEK